jgi:hypothetical protein
MYSYLHKIFILAKSGCYIVTFFFLPPQLVSNCVGCGRPEAFDSIANGGWVKLQGQRRWPAFSGHS